MKVTIEYAGLLDIKGVASGEAVELAAGSTVRDVLGRLGVEASHQKFITPLRNNQRAKLSDTLTDGDRLHLLLPVGGG